MGTFRPFLFSLIISLRGRDFFLLTNNLHNRDNGSERSYISPFFFRAASAFIVKNVWHLWFDKSKATLKINKGICINIKNGFERDFLVRKVVNLTKRQVVDYWLFISAFEVVELLTASSVVFKSEDFSSSGKVRAYKALKLILIESTLIGQFRSFLIDFSGF